MISLLAQLGARTTPREPDHASIRELLRKADRLRGEAEDLRSEARELEDKAGSFEKEAGTLQAAARASEIGVSEFAAWMLASLPLTPLIEARLRCSIATLDPHPVVAVAVWHGVALPLEFYPRIPAREVARGTVADLELFRQRLAL